MQIQLLTKDRNPQSVLCVRNTDLNVALADAKRIIATIDPEDVNVKINVKRAWDAEHSSDFRSSTMSPALIFERQHAVCVYTYTYIHTYRYTST